MATEDFDRERLGRRAAEGLASFSPVVNRWARDLRSALAEIERLRDAVTMALADLDEEHQPQWSSDEAAAKGKAPIGCALCWPGDGHWPCGSHLIADDLRAALTGSSEEAPVAEQSGEGHAACSCLSGRTEDDRG